eukprot:1837002-Amphidinium_carterae.2
MFGAPGVGQPTYISGHCMQRPQPPSTTQVGPPHLGGFSPTTLESWTSQQLDWFRMRKSCPNKYQTK